MSWGNFQIRPFLNTIANELTSDQIEEMKFLCYPKVTRARLEKVQSAQQLFVAVSEVFNEENEQLDYLNVLFRQIHRLDLATKIEDFQRSRARGPRQPESSNPQSSYPSTVSHQLPALFGQQQSYSQRHSHTGSLPNPYNDKDQSHSALSQYRSQQSVPYGQEEISSQLGDQPDKGHCSTVGDHSVFEGRGASENIHLSPQSSTECNDSDESVVYEGLQCPVQMTYQSMQQYFHVSDESKLGEGGFGTVYKGCRKFHGQNVVVKMEREQPLGQVYRAAQLKREKLVGFIKHPNLMPLFAVCEEKGRPCCLMYPLMDSDLQKALYRDLRGKQSLPWECRVRIALHTARGLQYLHSRVRNERKVREEIVHMDVKPGNIFLDKHLNARLGDPGMAQELEPGYSFASISQIRGTEGYLDRYLSDTHFKPVNDVFSFGIVLLQLLTQKEAMEPRADRNVKLWKQLEKEGYLSSPEKLMYQARPVWPRSDPTYTIIFCGIAIDCLKKPDERAKLPDVCKKLEEILEKQGEEFYGLKPADVGRCVSCLLNSPAKYLEVKSSQCDSHTTESCNHFCVTCLTQSLRNPLQCPQHGPAEPPIGRTNTYAVLVCGHDPNNEYASAAFMRDVSNFRNTLTDNRIAGVRNDHLYCITPSSCVSTIGSEVKEKLQYLQEELQGKNDVFLYFYFSGHSDESGNLICSSENDLLTETDLREDFEQLGECVDEFIVILDCCFADNKVPNKHLGNESFLFSKSEIAVDVIKESPGGPLEYLLENLKLTSDEIELRAGKEPLYSAIDETDLDSLDGVVMTKAAPNQAKEIASKSRGTFSVRQWSSSLGQQESLAVRKGSFFSLFMIDGLRGGHNCSLCVLNCKICEKFRDKANAVGYISAANLEDYISEHVAEAAIANGKIQTPCIRALRTKETKMAYFNQERLFDEIEFKYASGSSERIVMSEFSPSLVAFQSDLLGQLHGKLPACSKGKHLHVVCEEEEIDSTSYHDLKNLARQGYDVKCQLRPCSFIHKGPVMVEIQRCKESVECFLKSLGLAKVECSASSPYMMFQADTSTRQYTKYDIDECLMENTRLRRSLDGSVIDSITIILKTASLHRGLLSITVYEDHLDCEFQAS